MNCTTCQTPIAEGDERDHQEKTLCEDCYMEALSPPRFCDPWADYAAKSALKNNISMDLNSNQVNILALVKACGEVSPMDLIDKLKAKIPPQDVEGECAALKRMGKISIQRKNHGHVISLE